MGRVYAATDQDRLAGHIYPLPVMNSGRNSLFIWLGLTDLLKEITPDMVYCWEEPWCLSSFQVTRAAEKLGIPVIFYSAENRPKRLPGIFRKLQKRVYDRSQSAIAVTAQVTGRLKSTGYEKPIHEIPLWIRERPMVEARAESKALCYVGRLIKLKRVNLLIKAGYS